MAKGLGFDVDQIEVIKRLIRAECKDLADAVDETQMGNLKMIGTVTDRNSYNILKLQAQVTALKEVLFEKGTIGRGNLNMREERELKRLTKIVEGMANNGAPAGAMPS